MIDPLASFPLPHNSAAPDGPEWFIVLDTADDLSWWRDELIFAPSQSSAEAKYRAAAAGAGHTPGTVLVYRTNFYYFIPDDLPGYVAVAESNEFEAGEISITLNYRQEPIKVVNVGGKAGLLAILPPTVLDILRDPATGMAGLLRAAMSHLLMREACNRGAIHLH